jgi:glycosyltransferase involved in cell wall biosynthesis
MKILQVIPFFVPAWGFGGPVKVVYDISTSLVEKGYDVTVLTTDALDSKSRIPSAYEIISGIKVCRFRNFSPYLAKKFNLYLPFGFREYVKDNINNFDIIHLHAFFTYQNIVTAFYCKRKKIPYIIHLHESLVPKLDRGKFLFKTLFNLFFGKSIIDYASKIFVLTLKEKEELADYSNSAKDKIIILPNPLPKIDTDFSSRLTVCKTKEKTFLSLSRLSYLKGIDLLIRAFSELLKIDSKCKLVIAGPDENGQAKKLKKLVNELEINNNVEFLGLVEGKTKAEVYKNADVFVLFSRYEPFAITVLEAIQYNLPLCLSKNVGIANQVKKTGCGIIIDDASNSSKGALGLALAYEMRYKLSKNNSKMLQLFEMPRIIDLIINTYKEIV